MPGDLTIYSDTDGAGVGERDFAREEWDNGGFWKAPDAQVREAVLRGEHFERREGQGVAA